MRRRRIRLWGAVGLIVLIVVAQFAIFNPVRDFGRRLISGPVMVTSSIVDGVKSNISLIFSIRDLASENADLRQENLANLAQIAELANIKNENEQLRRDLRFSQERPDLNMTPATILSYSPVGSYHAVTIDKGSRDGVVVNQAVVSGGFLIGKVNSVSSTASEVWLLSNRNLLTPVILTGSNITGILKGGIRGLVVDNIPVDTDVDIGELVVTSSLEGLYPSGLAVGQVEEIISQQEEIFIRVRVSSPVNISNIRTVFVVQ